jgi:hypothetical protein
MAYNTMNNGYAEQQSSINWGKAALYGGGGLVAGGAARMGWRAMKGSQAGGWARDQAKSGWAKAGGWKGMKNFGSQAWGNMGSARARRRQVRGGVGMVRQAGVNMATSGMQSYMSSGGKTGGDLAKLGGSLQRVRSPGKRGFANGMKKAGYGGLNFFSGAGFSGMKRAGIAGARAGMLGAGLAAADFLNPFGFGWND